MVVGYKDRFKSLKQFETLRDVEDPVTVYRTGIFQVE